MRISTVVLLLCLCIVTGLPAQQSEDELQMLLQETLNNHPTIAAAQQKLLAAKARIPQASAWPDPVISIGANNYPFDFNPVNLSRFAMTQTKISVTQRLPISGTLELKEEAAQKQSEITAVSIKAVRLELSNQLRSLYTRLAFLQRKISLLGELEEIFEQLYQFSLSKYESGMIPLSAVLEVETSLHDLEAKRLTLQEKFESEKESLYWFIGSESIARDLTFDSQNQSAISINPEELLTAARKERPDYKQKNIEAELGDTLAALAEKEMAPDISLSFAYGYRYELTDLWSANVMITLPLHRDGRERQKIVEQKANARMSRIELEAIERKIRSNINSILSELRNLNNQVEHYENKLIPSIDLTTKATYARFQNNQVSITEVLRLYIETTNRKLQLVQLKEERELAKVKLDKLIGQIWPLGKEQQYEK